MPCPSGSPPCSMNSLMMRWKMTPSYSGFVDTSPVRGCFHSLAPVARPTKLSTVMGAWLPNRLTLMSPRVVWIVATAVGSGIRPLFHKLPVAGWEDAEPHNGGHHGTVPHASEGAEEAQALGRRALGTAAGSARSGRPCAARGHPPGSRPLA